MPCAFFSLIFEVYFMKEKSTKQQKASRKRFIPVTQQLGSTFKLFFIVWAVCLVVFFVGLGASKWAFWGGIGLGFMFAIPITYILMRVTSSDE
jgi:Na+-driven multidrug efflux pump